MIVPLIIHFTKWDCQFFVTSINVSTSKIRLKDRNLSCTLHFLFIYWSAAQFQLYLKGWNAGFHLGLAKSFFQMALSPCGPWLIFGLLMYSQSVGLLGRVISSSQGLYLNTGQHNHRINTYTHQTSMPQLRFEPTNTVRASEDSSCLGTLGYRDRHSVSLGFLNYHKT
jgi:hypothetical protein